MQKRVQYIDSCVQWKKISLPVCVQMCVCRGDGLQKAIGSKSNKVEPGFPTAVAFIQDR